MDPRTSFHGVLLALHPVKYITRLPRYSVSTISTPCEEPVLLLAGMRIVTTLDRRKFLLFRLFLNFNDARWLDFSTRHTRPN